MLSQRDGQRLNLRETHLRSRLSSPRRNQADNQQVNHLEDHRRNLLIFHQVNRRGLPVHNLLHIPAPNQVGSRVYNQVDNLRTDHLDSLLQYPRVNHRDTLVHNQLDDPLHNLPETQLLNPQETRLLSPPEYPRHNPVINQLRSQVESQVLNPVGNQLLNLLAVLLHYPHPNQVKLRLPNPLGTLRCNRVRNRQRGQPLCRVVSRVANHRPNPVINQVHNLLINQFQCPLGSLLRFQVVVLLCNQQDNLHLSQVSFRRPNPAPNHLLNLAVNQLESLHPNQVIDQVPHLLDFLVDCQLDNQAPLPVDTRHPNQAINQVPSQLHFLQASQLVSRLVAQVRSLAVNQQLCLPVNPVRYPRVSRFLYQQHFQRDHHQDFLQIFPLLNHRPPHQINLPGIPLLNRLLYQVKDHRLFRAADLRIFQLLCHLLFLQHHHLLNLAVYRLRYPRTDPVPTPHLHHLFNQVVNHL